MQQSPSNQPVAPAMHSPLPWTFRGSAVFDANDDFVASAFTTVNKFATNTANGLFIVQSVNRSQQYERMVEALNECISALRTIERYHGRLLGIDKERLNEIESLPPTDKP